MEPKKLAMNEKIGMACFNRSKLPIAWGIVAYWAKVRSNDKFGIGLPDMSERAAEREVHKLASGKHYLNLQRVAGRCLSSACTAALSEQKGLQWES